MALTVETRVPFSDLCEMTDVEIKTLRAYMAWRNKQMARKG